MRSSWKETRTRASRFAKEWNTATYEKGETQSFYNEFFEIFGVRRRNVARYEAHVEKLDNKRGYIDLFWPGVLIVEQKSTGRSLSQAREQALGYFDALPERQKPRYLLVSDFQTFELHDLDEDKAVTFALKDLPEHVQSFGFIMGVKRRTFRDQDPANIEAAETIGRLHDALKAARYRAHDLERLLVRIVFCLFADDTGIFEPRDIFLDFIEERTKEDGSDLGALLAQLFEVLDTEEDERSPKLDEDLARFPYVNGALFEGALRIPAFDACMRERLLDACRFDWTHISPAIFGSLFQSVMTAGERRAQGIHYTTEKNIRKVIEPLFLDELKHELKRLKASRGKKREEKLIEFQQKLGSIQVLDPACGCGNFLVIAYRELRLLEMEAIEAREGFAYPQVDVDQFHGIELDEFATRIAETAMWMMDHIMNNDASLRLEHTYARIPLEKTPNILHADALETEWGDVLPATECRFVIGNPPFIGAKYQTREQREQVHRIAALGKTGGTLDYVSAWLIKAGEYAAKGTSKIGLVATNSMTQGEQVAQLWPVLFGRYRLDITFAHQTFAWGSDARGKAHVHVVIVGLENQRTTPKEKRLFTYPDVNGEPEESRHTALSPYLVDASKLANRHVVVREESAPINGMPQLVTGSQPIEGGNCIFDATKRAAFVQAEPDAEPWLRPFIGAQEYLHNGERWILALQNAPPEVLARLPRVRERIAAVRTFRERSRRKSTVKLAETPTIWQVNILPETPFLVIPEVSSERREYAPIGWLEPPVIPSNKLRLLVNASLSDFALLTSAMHMAWMRAVTGRLENRYMYSVGVVYNTFPTPREGRSLAALEPLAQRILEERAKHPNATLADLYAPDLMPIGLRKAHQAVDKAVDKLYRRRPFRDEQERVEHLFQRYEEMQGMLHAQMQSKRRKKS